MRRAVVAIALAVTALGGTGASAMPDEGPGPAVSILRGSYEPAQIDVLAGDTVTWSNDSVLQHTVTATDGSFSSDRLVAGDRYAHTFDTPGAVPYYCQVHGFMRGEVDVHRLLLTPPREPGGAGQPYVLLGRAALPPDTPVAIEADAGGGFQPAGRALVDEHGDFRATVTPQTSAMYRAVAGGEASPAVQLLVLDRKVVASASGHGTRTVVNAQVLPASPGALVVLQLHLRERFGWWPVRHLRLDSASRARFVVRLDHRVRARVVLTLRDGATQLALSRAFHIGPRRAH